MSGEIKTVQSEEFLRCISQGVRAIDVRSPAEYLEGHIPNAINIPLFDDNERKIVGTTYKKVGRDEAVLTGLEMVGPKMSVIAKKAKELSKNGEILVHCWRGGMRSGSVAWLLKTVGLTPILLEGGYKEYRRFIRENFNLNKRVVVLGGMTGSGKTKFLSHLKELGESVIDLEELARHRGSAFGHIGLGAQPTNEQFENNLAKEWLELSDEKLLFLEDESSHIGKVGLPIPFYELMGKSKLILLDVPKEVRVKNLSLEYGTWPKTELIEAVERIEKKIGGASCKEISTLISNDNLELAAEKLLTYYDKTYSYSLEKRGRKDVMKICCNSMPSKEEAIKLRDQIYGK